MIEQSDFQPNIITLYRELGTIEGRVKALEDTTMEIKAMLGAMGAQLTSIQATVSTALGRKEGSDKAFSTIGFILNIAISGVTAYIIMKYGNK
jgi:hypothetical protein